MKKLLIPLAILLICAFIVAGCSNASPTTTTPAATKPAVTTPAATAPVITTPAATTPAATKPAATTQAIISPTPASGTGAKYGGTVKWIDPVAPGTPLGVPWESNFPSGAMQLSLEPLLKEQLDGTLLPRLAVSWQIDANLQNPSMTFQLRKGVKFQDGTDFNAQAVKYNFDKLKAAGLFSSPRYYKSVDVIDDYTIKIPFTEYRNSLLPAFAQNMSYMVSPTAFEKNGIDWMRWHMVGTGPYLHTDFRRDVSVKAVRNDNYWEKGKPYLDAVEYLFVADELTRTALFKSGEADILNTANNGRIASEFQSQGYKILTQPLGTDGLFPDSANPDSPWANIKVRQAAEYAIDKEAIAKAFGYGFQTASYQLPSPASIAYNSTLPGRKYDVAKAKQLLTEAGYPSGFKSKIVAQNTVNKDTLIAVQSQLGKVGIQIDLELTEPAKFVEYQQGTWKNALLYVEMSQGANFNQTLGFSFAAPRTNYKSLKNPDGWQDMMTETMRSPNMDAKILQKLVKALYDDTTIITINYKSAMWVTKNNLQDSGIGSRGGTPYWNSDEVWLSK